MQEYDINQLGLNPEEFNDVDFDKMPTTIGSIVRPPQPGVYLFRLPTGRGLFGAIEPYATTEWGQRVMAKLKDDAALLNVTLSEPYNANLNNTPRWIGKGDNRQAVSDWLMLLKALGIAPEGNNNAAHVQALLSAAGREFKAEHTLSTTCNKNRDIYKDGKVHPGVKGCGQEWRVEGYKTDKKEVFPIPPEDDGKVALRFECVCGAELTSWGRLQGFRSAE